ncbi:hypothetical protein H2200_004101 [Cladophialophora chaetospira]|uniref:Uncharacterized protein n=1 Tax=Cladophialophora chaetospira TaxID=386627 RepID=A0AA38XGA3_9EURO|nr:hypothetical protein H2200_004101 [Cladophialophora chaetospira]
MTSNTTIVVGASRGIGLELVRYLASNPENHVIATMRKPFNFEQANINVLELDQTNQRSVNAAARKVAEADTLIVNGAIGEDELLTQISSDRLLRYLDINVAGPHRVINAFLPALRARKTRKNIYISSTAASLTGQVGEKWGLQGPYATSKAAGNMLTVQFHNELEEEGFTVVAIHPGWVATDMGNLAGPGAMPAIESVQKIMRIVDGLEKGDGAKFFNIDGTILPCIRHIRSRPVKPIDFRKIIEGKGNVSAQGDTVKLSPEHKHELDAIDQFRLLMREKAESAARAASSSTQDMTIEHIVELVDPRTKGFKKVASKLQTAYSGRLYEEVDSDLNSIMPFKSKGHVLSDSTERILTRLEYLGDSVETDSVPSDQVVSLTPNETPVPEEALTPKTDSVPEPQSAAPVPNQQSILIDTPKDFLDLTPEQLLATGGEDQKKKKEKKKKSPRPGSTSKPRKRAFRKINTIGVRFRNLRNVRSTRAADVGKIAEKTTRAGVRKTGSTKDEDGGHIAEMMGDRVQVASGAKIPLTPMSMDTPEVPRLSHDLSRVLFNPGVYQLQDPRSRVWNFDPYLGNLMPVSEFNYDALNKYITSSEDVHLREVAQQRGKRYIGSTSSMSGALVHFHFLLSAFRKLNLENLSRGFSDEGSASFTRIQKGPSAIFLRYKDGVYAVDADKEFDSANILMSLGRSMEKLLTSDKEQFERYRRTEDAAKDADVNSTQPEAYHYSGLGQFLLRSQLDAYDPRLPGTGMFDLKTRAVAAVRHMVRDHEKGMGYQIKERFGTWESYEREYFDMMRSAFLKYSLQVRMGRMDGIFVAYHNTERLFGFQYVPLPELDFALHGQSDRVLGDQEFSLSIQLLNYIFNEATMQHPGQSLRFHFEARPATSASPQFMYVFAEPVTEDEIVAIQNSKKDEIRAFEERIFNPLPKDGADDADLETTSEPMPAVQQSNAANVQFLDSILGIDISEAMSPEKNETSSSDSDGETAQRAGTPPSPAPEKPLSAWKLTIRNLVNGKAVLRPEKLTGADTWGLQYSAKPLSSSEARRNYIMCKNRRKTALESPQDADVAANFYLQRLISMSRDGAEWRQLQDELDAEKERVVLYGG